MTRLNLNNADFSGSNFNRSNLSGGTFTESNLTNTQFRRAYLVGLRGERVDMSGASFEDATLTEAELDNSLFAKANLRRADLTRGSFANSDFSGADFRGAITTEANFTGSKFTGADMSTAQGLTQIQLDSACGTPDTLLPIGLSIPYCDTVVMAEFLHDTSRHAALSPQNSQAAIRLDTAIDQVETLMIKTRTEDIILLRELQSIHANLVSSRRDIEN